VSLRPEVSELEQGPKDSIEVFTDIPEKHFAWIVAQFVDILSLLSSVLTKYADCE
jgi:hypothetical protein